MLQSCLSHIHLLELGQSSNTSWAHQANYAKKKEEEENLLVSTRKSKFLNSMQDRT